MIADFLWLLLSGSIASGLTWWTMRRELRAKNEVIKYVEGQRDAAEALFQQATIEHETYIATNSGPPAPLYPVADPWAVVPSGLIPGHILTLSGSFTLPIPQTEVDTYQFNNPQNPHEQVGVPEPIGPKEVDIEDRWKAIAKGEDE